MPAVPSSQIGVIPGVEVRSTGLAGTPDVSAFPAYDTDNMTAISDMRNTYSPKISSKLEMLSNFPVDIVVDFQV